MTVVLFDGFDVYNGVVVNTGLLTKWTQFNLSGSSQSLVSGRFGGQAARLTRNGSGQGGSIQRPFPGNYASFSVGMAMRWVSLTSILATYPDVAFYDGTPTIQCGMKVDANGAINVYRYTSETAGTLLGASANGVIQPNTWHYIEVEVTISDTVGVFKVYVDGVQQVNLTGLDNKNTANAYASNIRFSSASASGWNMSLDVDDFYLTDAATKLGERRVETIYPTSDVAQGFARSTGATNYTLVDEAQVNGDTDYVQGSSVGDTDTYGLGDLSSTPTAVDAVQVISFAEKTDAGSRSFALQVKSGATTSDGSNYALAASYGKFERLLTQDPNGPTAWTASAVNALQGGPKVTV